MNLLGVINDRSYGIVCYNILKHLKCKYWPLFQTQQGLDIDYNLIESCQKLPYKNDISLRIWHQFDLANHVCSHRVGFPIFELDRFNSLELEHLSAQDDILVCSNWAKQVLSTQGLNSDVIPLGVDPHMFFPIKGEQHDTCRFLCIGKWEIRKGHDFLIKCWKAAFTPKDKVELWMSCHNPFLNQSEIETWKSIYEHPQVKFIPWVQSQKDLNILMNQVDGGVFLSRAEGWNLEALEMMACNKPVIMTNYSGHTEYATHKNALLVECPNKELAVDGKWFFGQGEWAQLNRDQLDQTVEYLRYIYRVRPQNPNGVTTASQFTWENAAQKIGVKYGLSRV